jgi:hypothetical protein
MEPTCTPVSAFITVAVDVSVLSATVRAPLTVSATALAVSVRVVPVAVRLSLANGCRAELEAPAT